MLLGLRLPPAAGREGTIETFGDYQVLEKLAQGGMARCSRRASWWALGGWWRSSARVLCAEGSFELELESP